MELEQAVLKALRQALAEGEFEAAEHLLRALEVVCSDEPCAPLNEAYTVLANVKRGRGLS